MLIAKSKVGLDTLMALETSFRAAASCELLVQLLQSSLSTFYNSEKCFLVFIFTIWIYCPIDFGVIKVLLFAESTINCYLLHARPRDPAAGGFDPRYSNDVELLIFFLCCLLLPACECFVWQQWKRPLFLTAFCFLPSSIPFEATFISVPLTSTAIHYWENNAETTLRLLYWKIGRC